MSIPKSSVILEVKPWDDETDMTAMEAQVRTIVMDGLVWGEGRLVPVGFGINKLQICCVVEDSKAAVDVLVAQIEGFEDYVQSVEVTHYKSTSSFFHNRTEN